MKWLAVLIAAFPVWGGGLCCCFGASDCRSEQPACHASNGDPNQSPHREMSAHCREKVAGTDEPHADAELSGRCRCGNHRAEKLLAIPAVKVGAEATIVLHVSPVPVSYRPTPFGDRCEMAVHVRGSPPERYAHRLAPTPVKLSQFLI